MLRLATHIVVGLMLVTLFAFAAATYDPILLHRYLPPSPYRIKAPEVAWLVALLALAWAIAEPGAQAKLCALFHLPNLRQLQAAWRPFLAAIVLMDGATAALGYVEHGFLLDILAELNWTSRALTAVLILRCFTMAAAAWRLLQGGAPGLTWRCIGLLNAGLALVLLANVFWSFVKFEVLGSGGSSGLLFNPGPVTIDVIALWAGIALLRGRACGPADPFLSVSRWAARVVYLFFSYRLLAAAYGSVSLRLSMDVHLGQPVFWPNIIISVVAFLIGSGHALRAVQGLGYEDRARIGLHDEGVEGSIDAGTRKFRGQTP
ncbi:hypothetical protein DLREEDagr8_52390 [Dongia sp. agr-C8]